MDSVLLILGHAFGNPHHIADFLLPQPHVGEKYAVMELLLKCISAALDFFLVQDLQGQGSTHIGERGGGGSRNDAKAMMHMTGAIATQLTLSSI